MNDQSPARLDLPLLLASRVTVYLDISKKSNKMFNFKLERV